MSWVPDLLDVLQRADELSASEALAGRSAAEAELDRMIEIVRVSLARTASTLWWARAWCGARGGGRTVRASRRGEEGTACAFIW
jgi:hypothetical protein